MMKEDFLHYVWKFQKFIPTPLITTAGAVIEVEKTGYHNQLEGPDFFNAHIRIDDQLWAGNVEMHLKTSDWYAHRHELDSNYDSVILHVVWEHDVDVFRVDGTAIYTLEIKDVVLATALANYEQLSTANYSWIACESQLYEVSPIVRNHWLERLYIERLEYRAGQMFRTLEQYDNHWDALLFIMLCKNFGLQLNGDSFYSLVSGLDASVLRKCIKDPFELESLLLGRAGLLANGEKDAYQAKLWKHYQYVVAKYNIRPQEIIAPRYFRLRPTNFPTIRLSQFAQLMASQQRLFSRITSAEAMVEILPLFQIKASAYWDTHFNFGVTSRSYAKKLSPAFIELLCINTVIPLIFCYGKYIGKDVSERVLSMAEGLSAEKNSTIKKFEKIGHTAANALESQALLQLYKNYCTPLKCLQCAIGNTLLKKT